MLSQKGGSDNLLTITYLHNKSAQRRVEVNPFTAKDAIWRPQVITHTAICLTFANKYFYVSQHSMRLF